MATTRTSGLLGHDYLARAGGPFWIDDKGCHRGETPGPTGVRHRTPIRVADAGDGKSKKPTKKTVFHPGVMHNHQPSGRWADVQDDPNTSSLKVAEICKNFAPENVLKVAGMIGLSGDWIAIDHLKWFVSDGGGADFVEDSNLDLMLRTDSGVQAVLRAKIPAGSTGTFADHVEIQQSDYAEEDFQYAFGAIDRLDFEVDFAAGTIHAWFQDGYEWHPVYPFYDKQSGDIVRETNCVHAAAVELKSGTARDYWMKGEATIPLHALQSATSKPSLTAGFIQ
jgi:hypothetical protein